MSDESGDYHLNDRLISSDLAVSNDRLISSDLAVSNDRLISSDLAVSNDRLISSDLTDSHDMLTSSGRVDSSEQSGGLQTSSGMDDSRRTVERSLVAPTYHSDDNGGDIILSRPHQWSFVRSDGERLVEVTETWRRISPSQLPRRDDNTENSATSHNTVPESGQKQVSSTTAPSTNSVQVPSHHDEHISCSDLRQSEAVLQTRTVDGSVSADESLITESRSFHHHHHHHDCLHHSLPSLASGAVCLPCHAVHHHQCDDGDGDGSVSLKCSSSSLKQKNLTSYGWQRPLTRSELHYIGDHCIELPSSDTHHCLKYHRVYDQHCLSPPPSPPAATKLVSRATSTSPHDLLSPPQPAAPPSTHYRRRRHREFIDVALQKSVSRHDINTSVSRHRHKEHRDVGLQKSISRQDVNTSLSRHSHKGHKDIGLQRSVSRQDAKTSVSRHDNKQVVDVGLQKSISRQHVKTSTSSHHLPQKQLVDVGLQKSVSRQNVKTSTSNHNRQKEAVDIGVQKSVSRQNVRTSISRHHTPVDVGLQKSVSRENAATSVSAEPASAAVLSSSSTCSLSSIDKKVLARIIERHREKHKQRYLRDLRRLDEWQRRLLCEKKTSPREDTSLVGAVSSISLPSGQKTAAVTDASTAVSSTRFKEPRKRQQTQHTQTKVAAVASCSAQTVQFSSPPSPSSSSLSSSSSSSSSPSTETISGECSTTSTCSPSSSAQRERRERTQHEDISRLADLMKEKVRVNELKMAQKLARSTRDATCCYQQPHRCRCRHLVAHTGGSRHAHLYCTEPHHVCQSPPAPVRRSVAYFLSVDKSWTQPARAGKSISATTRSAEKSAVISPALPEVRLDHVMGPPDKPLSSQLTTHNKNKHQRERASSAKSTERENWEWSGHDHRSQSSSSLADSPASNQSAIVTRSADQDTAGGGRMTMTRRFRSTGHKQIMSLQSALQTRRPDYIHNAWVRHHYLSELAAARRYRRQLQQQTAAECLLRGANAAEYERQWHQLTERHNSSIQRHVVHRAFNYRDMRQHTARLCRQLPEHTTAAARHRLQQRKKSNLVMWRVYRQRLQQLCLKGTVNMTHTDNLLTAV